MARLGGNATVVVELLYFDGCPRWRQATAAVDEAARITGVGVEVRSNRVSSPDDALRRRFLGSPTVRIEGRDVEPRAEKRSDNALACRVYESRAGRTSSPPVEGIAAALREAASAR